jgi:hypothetical protein
MKLTLPTQSLPSLSHLGAALNGTLPSAASEQQSSFPLFSPSKSAKESAAPLTEVHRVALRLLQKELGLMTPNWLSERV